MQPWLRPQWFPVRPPIPVWVPGLHGPLHHGESLGLGLSAMKPESPPRAFEVTAREKGVWWGLRGWDYENSGLVLFFPFPRLLLVLFKQTGMESVSAHTTWQSLRPLLFSPPIFPASGSLSRFLASVSSLHFSQTLFSPTKPPFSAEGLQLPPGPLSPHFSQRQHLESNPHLYHFSLPSLPALQSPQVLEMTLMCVKAAWRLKPTWISASWPPVQAH